MSLDKDLPLTWLPALKGFLEKLDKRNMDEYENRARQSTARLIYPTLNYTHQSYFSYRLEVVSSSTET